MTHFTYQLNVHIKPTNETFEVRSTEEEVVRYALINWYVGRSDTVGKAMNLTERVDIERWVLDEVKLGITYHMDIVEPMDAGCSFLLIRL